MLDAKALATATAAIVKSHVAEATAPLLRRIETLEARPYPERGEKGEPGQSIRGETGVGVAGALIDRSGVLILTLSDGTTRELGAVVGKDGQNGANGVDGLPGEPGKDGEKGADGLNGIDGKDGRDGLDGKDGEPGKDGVDGFGFDDLEVVHDGERGFTFKFTKGDRVKEFPFEVPVVLDRGVYKAGETYHPGDGVTWAGSYWIAKNETQAKPDGGEDWRLAIKRGRDGKDAK